MRGWGGTTGLVMPDLEPTALDRFWKKVDKSGPLFGRSRCWIWIGSRTRKYGMWSVPGVGIYQAHQILYALTHEDGLPAGRIMSQRCSTDGCIRHWNADTPAEARRKIELKRARATLPIDDIRRLRKAGATCSEIAKQFPGIPHSKLREIYQNQKAVDTKYRPRPIRRRREEHPELCTPRELVAVVREARAAGHTLQEIAQAACLPLTTVWEAINGPSKIARRQAA